MSRESLSLTIFLLRAHHVRRSEVLGAQRERTALKRNVRRQLRSRGRNLIGIVNSGHRRLILRRLCAYDLGRHEMLGKQFQRLFRKRDERHGIPSGRHSLTLDGCYQNRRVSA